jgi:DNA-binding MarR family transcriptional regulator
MKNQNITNTKLIINLGNGARRVARLGGRDALRKAEQKRALGLLKIKPETTGEEMLWLLGYNERFGAALIEDLEKAGYIATQPDSEQTDVQIITLTDEGKTAASAVDENADDWLFDFLDEEDRAKLNEWLLKATENLKLKLPVSDNPEDENGFDGFYNVEYRTHAPSRRMGDYERNGRFEGRRGFEERSGTERYGSERSGSERSGSERSGAHEKGSREFRVIYRHVFSCVVYIESNGSRMIVNCKKMWKEAVVA